MVASAAVGAWGTLTFLVISHLELSDLICMTLSLRKESVSEELETLTPRQAPGSPSRRAERLPPPSGGWWPRPCPVTVRLTDRCAVYFSAAKLTLSTLQRGSSIGWSLGTPEQTGRLSWSA